MAIGLVCKSCGARLKVAETAAGKVGKCPKCQQPIRVPKTDAPEAHFCDQCGVNLAGQEMHMVNRKMYCGNCYKDEHVPKDAGDPILEQIGLNIPGLVVLRGKEQRQMGRVLQDVHAKKGFKNKDQEPQIPTEVESEPEEPPEEPEQPAEEQAPEEPEVPAEEPAEAIPEEKEAVGEPAGTAAEDGFGVPTEEPETAVEPEPEPAIETPPPASEPEPAPEPEPAKEEAPEPPSPPKKLHKGQKESDSLLIRLLLEKGVVLEGELELALQYQKGIGKRLIPVLDDLKLTSEEDIIEALAKSTGLEACPPGELEIQPHVEGLLDDELIGMYEAVPLTREGESLIVALPNPLDTEAIKALRSALNVKVIPKICAWTQFKDAKMTLKKASGG